MNTILLHGALGSGIRMRPLADLLGDALPCPDLIGHGSLADTDGPMTIEAMAGQVAEMIDRPTDLIGFSMGGYVALCIAARHPEKVRSVVTLGTKFAWTVEGAASETRMLDPVRIAEKVPAFAAQLGALHGDHWQDVVRRTAGMMTALGASPALHGGSLAKVQCPVLLMRGSGDSMVSEEETAWAAGLIPDSRVVTLERQPHPIEKVDVRTVAAEVQRFHGGLHG